MFGSPIQTPSGPLFALLKPPDATPGFVAWRLGDLLHAYLNRADYDKSWPERLAIYKTNRGPFAIPREHWPTLVGFKDVRDPKSVYVVPQMLRSEVTAVAIPSIEDVTLEFTDRSITTGIEAFLPWLNTIGQYNLGGTKYLKMTSWPERLQRSNFVLRGEAHNGGI